MSQSVVVIKKLSCYNNYLPLTGQVRLIAALMYTESVFRCVTAQNFGEHTRPVRVGRRGLVLRDRVDERVAGQAGDVRVNVGTL